MPNGLSIQFTGFFVSPWCRYQICVLTVKCLKHRAYVLLFSGSFNEFLIHLSEMKSFSAINGEVCLQLKFIISQQGCDLRR